MKSAISLVLAGLLSVFAEQRQDPLSQSSHPRFLTFSRSPVFQPTAAPSAQPTGSVKDVVPGIGGRNDTGNLLIEVYPLGLCEGDCDTDEDCEGDLICFQREANDPVPSCSGGSSISSVSDFCTYATETPSSIPSLSPSSNPSLPPSFSPSVQPSENPSEVPSIDLYPDLFTFSVIPPPSAFPLGLCEGDCNDDSDCGGGLICYERDAFESVPGCRGGSTLSSLTDFCVFAGARSDTSSVPSGVPSMHPSIFPSTIPSTGPSLEPTVVSDYPAVFTYEISVPPAAFPLQLCQGDCDDDDDCEGDLICYERDKYEAVPGCTGGIDTPSKTDFCVDPNAPNVTMAPSTSSYPSEIPSESPSSTPSQQPSLPVTLFVYQSEPPASAFPLPLCHGDCDSDDDCEEGLRCFQRDKNEEVPSCEGGAMDSSLTDYCTYPFPTSQPSQSSVPSSSFEPSATSSDQPSQVSMVSSYPSSAPSLVPSSSPTLRSSSSPSGTPSTMTPNDFIPIFAFDAPNPPADALPLGVCTGDCDSDQECGEGLYCYERDAGEEVPGCLGGAGDTSDTDYCTRIEFAPVLSSNSTFFRLKLEFPEQDWCMACENECVVGDRLYLRQCSGRSTYFELIDLGFGESLIEASGTGNCLERRANFIDLRVCDSAKTSQRFVASDDSDLTSTDSFELTQIGRRTNCVSPLAASFAEAISMGLCSTAQSNTVSVWGKL